MENWLRLRGTFFNARSDHLMIIMIMICIISKSDVAVCSVEISKVQCGL